MNRLPRIALVSALTLAIGILAVPEPAEAQSPAAQAIIDQKIPEWACVMGGGGRMKPEGVIEQDITGDGQVDLILDLGFVECDQGRNYACGVQACPTFFYVRQGDRLVEAANILAMGVIVGEGNPPILNLTAHGGSPFKRQWNGETFAEPAVQFTAPATARWQYDPAWGFIGQATVQGEHGSTLRVGCNDNGFPALYLLNAAAPMSANLTFELDGMPAQSYLVDCGDDQSCTIESGYEDSLTLTRGLMARNTLTVSWNGRLVDLYSLSGSSAAISQLGERGCDL